MCHYFSDVPGKPLPSLGGSRQIEGDEQRTVELGQGGGGELAPPAAEATGRQRTHLLAQGDRIHVEATIWRVQEDLTRVQPPSCPIGRSEEHTSELQSQSHIS